MDIVLFAAQETVISPNGISGAQYLSATIGVVLPILVALATKHSTNPKMKSMLLLLLSAISGFLTEMLNATNFNWQQALFGTVLTFVVGTASLFGLWKPTGVDNAAKRVVVHD